MKDKFKTANVAIYQLAWQKYICHLAFAYFCKNIIQDTNAATLKYTNVKEYKSHVQENFTVIVMIDFILYKPPSNCKFQF